MEKRTKRKNFLNSFLAFLVMAVMLIGSISQVVLADDYEAGKTGTITLTVQEAGDDGTVKPIPNVKLTLYKVGGVTFDGNVHFVADGALQFTGIDFENIKTAEDWYKAAESLSAAVKKAGISGSEMQSDANGNIVYNNMAEGVYLIVQSNPDDPNVSVSPMVLTVPFVEEGTGWTFNVQAYPKTITRDGDKETKIKVTKRLYYINQDTFDVIEMEADDATYKVGLFLDDKGTIPFRSDYMKDIRLVKASSGTATWANVPDGKYYVFELDENGDPMTINDSIIIDEGKSYYYDVTDSNENATNEAEISQNGSTESVSYVNNYYSFIPTGFALKGHITINKKVLVDGQETTVPDTFYAAVFETGADDSLNLVEGTIRELNQNGSVDIEVSFPENTEPESVTYTVMETDKDGNPVDDDTFKYTVTGQGEVTLNNDNRYTVTKEITNSLSSEPTPIPTVTPGTNHGGNDRITPIPNNGTAGGTAPNDTSGTARRSVKTGDDTPIGVWVGILAAAIIVGGGAAGLMAAVTAKDFGIDVAILEATDRIGKKILATGNGRCNISNISITEPFINYHSNNDNFYYETLKSFSVKDTLDFFLALGLPIVELQSSKLYPQSLQASSVVDIFRLALEDRNIPVYTECKVKDIHRGKVFKLSTNNESLKLFTCDKLLLTCGGKTAPKTGSDGTGYYLSEKLGHSIIPQLPGIVQLKLDYPHLKS